MFPLLLTETATFWCSTTEQRTMLYHWAMYSAVPLSNVQCCTTEQCTLLYHWATYNAVPLSYICTIVLCACSCFYFRSVWYHLVFVVIAFHSWTLWGAYVTIFILPHHLGSHRPSSEDFPYENGRKKQRCDPGCRIREEIGAMQSSGRVQRDIQTNTEKYLALALPPSHNQGQFWIWTPFPPHPTPFSSPTHQGQFLIWTPFQHTPFLLSPPPPSTPHSQYIQYIHKEAWFESREVFECKCLCVCVCVCMCVHMYVYVHMHACVCMCVCVCVCVCMCVHVCVCVCVCMCVHMCVCVCVM